MDIFSFEPNIYRFTYWLHFLSKKWLVNFIDTLHCFMIPHLIQLFVCFIIFNQMISRCKVIDKECKKK